MRLIRLKLNFGLTKKYSESGVWKYEKIIEEMHKFGEFGRMLVEKRIVEIVGK